MCTYLLGIWLFGPPWGPEGGENIGKPFYFNGSKYLFLKSSKPSPYNQLVVLLAGMFIGWSSTAFVFLVEIGNSTWLPGPIMHSDCQKL